MKKTMIAGIGALVLTLSIGTAVYAADAGKSPVETFKDMLPHMQQMHPDLKEKELKDMHKDCRKSGDSMQDHMRNGTMMNGMETDSSL